MKNWARAILIVAFFGGIVETQYIYDAQKAQIPETDFPVSAKFLSYTDLGLHSTLASYLWLFKTRTELIRFLFLPKEDQKEGYSRYARDLAVINTLDPRYSAPYTLSVIALPSFKYADGVQAAISIGKRGIEQADPDWQIPFYLAVIYHIDLKDKTNAYKYFDIAGRTPGIPEQIRVFALNYGSIPTIREQTKQIWGAIYETTDDPDTKERAKKYVVHLTIMDYLESAAKTYKKQFGEYPKDIQGLVSKKIISEIPKDPLDFEFYMYTNGEIRVKEASSTSEK